jgi:hypothetical protein
MLSVAVLIPCFWQAHIQSTDLPSHLYNAWLYTQVVAHRLPGLVIVHQKTNLLMDELLAHTMKWWGPVWAERSVVGLSVLVFFWGAFRFITVLANRRPWHLTPLLAMLTYGVVFRWGFLNFYASLGLGLWAGSFAWSRRPLNWLWALLLGVLAITAHATSPLWIATVLLYFRAVNWVGLSQRIWMFGGSLAAVMAGHFALRHWAHCEWPDFGLIHFRLYVGFVGLGQIAPYGRKYWIVSGLVLLLWLPWLFRAVQRWSMRSILDDVVVQLALLHIIVSVLAPVTVELPGYPPGLGLGLINFRLSLLTSLSICALLARINPPCWHTVTLTLIGALFFSFAYADERAVNQAEERIRRLVSTLPPWQRMIVTVQEKAPKGTPQLIHLLDRPCIGRCFDYANYEPMTNQFRLRANQPNPYVLSDSKDLEAVEAGIYRVKDEDTPLYQIHLCEPHEFRFCAELVSPGQVLTMQDMSVQPSFWRSTLGDEE